MSDQSSRNSRGRLLALLRTGGKTVHELATELRVTDNAVRAHLVNLQTEGVIQQGPNRKGFRKPHQTFELSAKAQSSFAKAYEPVLNAVLESLKARMTRKQRENLLVETGKNMGSANKADEKLGLEARLNEAARLLEQLGGLPEVQQNSCDYLIAGYGCPLAAVVATNPEVCLLAEALLSEVAGVQGHSECIYSPSPNCRFRFHKVPA